MGIRAISRFTGFSLGTILNILESAGAHCARLMDAKIRNLKVTHVQSDEVFSWIGEKPDGANKHNPERGEMWTFLSIAQKEKLVINYRVSKRTGWDAEAFLKDLKSRLASRIQLTTDGFRGYVNVDGFGGAVERIFGTDQIDYATETKKIEKDPSYTGQRAYFAPKKVKVNRQWRTGMPDMAEATTNHAERTNLSLRTFNRRFVRCTINFSKKRENHEHAVAVFAAFFNFCRVHKTLGVTPAMAAGLTDHVWTVEELLTQK